MTTLEIFIERICQRDLPQNPMSRIKTLARELAEGAAAGLWAVSFYTQYYQDGDEQIPLPEPDNIKAYLRQRWDGYRQYPDFGLLKGSGYIVMDGVSRFSAEISLTPAAFALIEEVNPSTLFVSYKRGESSAFALLLVARLKHAGLEPFLDMALVPGENWYNGLKERVQSREYFIVLLGPTTLQSEVTLKEIEWAMEVKATIIPIWHNGFVYKSTDWKLPPEINNLLANTHTIRVTEENPLAYNNAIVELLNRFGITP